LLPAVHLPRSLADHEDLPTGGISDVSNRGPLARLLLNELAHDDLTLAVRIALGEALYLRREAPPRSPPKHRGVLIDAGIRLWGVPRVFAAAVALSLAASSDRNVRVHTFRASGRSVEPVVLTRREGLIAHLEALEPDAHPGDALAAFLAVLAKEGDLLDAVVVTSEDVAADRGFQRAIATLKSPALLLATVSREGRFRLASCGRQRKILREARLDLDELLAPPGRPKATLLDAGAMALPAILRQRPFPLLLSHPRVDSRRAWVLPGHGVLSISRGCGLLHWRHPGQGAHLLAENVQTGQVQWATSGPGTAAALAEASTSLAVVGELQSPRLWLLRIDVGSGDCRSIPLELSGPMARGVCGHGGAVFVVYDGRADVFEPVGGRRLGLLNLPRGARWRHGRFLQGKDGWYAISHDGVTGRVEPLAAGPGARKVPDLIAMVDNAEGDGPIALTSEGHLYDLARQRLIRVAHGLLGIPRVLAIARSGQRIVIAQFDDRAKMSCIGIPSGASQRASGDPALCAEPDIAHYTGRPRNVSHRFRAACSDEGRHLAIQRLKGSFVGIELDRQGRDMVLCCRATATSRQESYVEFQEIRPPADAGYTLQAATWKDGSRAVLDSRGMLHLKSSHAEIPELTLVLGTGALAGWCADGRWFGPPYFIGDHQPVPGVAIYEGVLRPFLSRLR
jgi:hypothetical protein